MTDETVERVDAEEAVKRAFHDFHDLHRWADEPEAFHILLDGIDVDEDTNTWVVTIGFDIEREKRSGSFTSATDSLSGLFDKDLGSTIRRQRIFYISRKTGQRIKMESRP